MVNTPAQLAKTLLISTQPRAVPQVGSGSVKLTVPSARPCGLENVIRGGDLRFRSGGVGGETAM